MFDGEISMKLHATYGVWQVDSIFALLFGSKGDRNRHITYIINKKNKLN
jgi:hypothetical protein